ncbi:uncharacterized protein TNCT_226591 [Trichonephila clavata]|uniref:Uncharacterized protein n=1 Tax=Trichonephila clavata TaxID=2740835 RepID=A0A8X6L7Y1_TRICU|nr:uncharacterized protein TNCT_226591 [Trichonephila clavata]
MNFPRYSSLYARFHGCTSFRIEDFTVILDFADESFTNWSLLHLYRFDRLTTDAKHTFAEALKVFFKTEAPLTVACEHDTWTAVLGNSKIIMPSLEDSATFQLYATPYFVSDPSLVAAYLQGVARAASDYIFMYKNCVLYLDKNDLPSPGGVTLNRLKRVRNPCTASVSSAMNLCNRFSRWVQNGKRVEMSSRFPS